jgi:hypothetical protein
MFKPADAAPIVLRAESKTLAAPQCFGPQKALLAVSKALAAPQCFGPQKALLAVSKALAAPQCFGPEGVGAWLAGDLPGTGSKIRRPGRVR